jgi:hypothetical protein
MQQANKGLMLSLVSIAMFAGAAIHQTSEIDAGAYRVLRDGFKGGTAEYRSAIAKAMRSGDISRWEYRNLLALSRGEKGVTAVDSGELNLREERLILAAMTRQVRIP